MKWWAWIIVALAVLSVIYRKSITAWIDEQEKLDAEKNAAERLQDNLSAANTGDQVKTLVNQSIKRGDFILVEDKNSSIIEGQPLSENVVGDIPGMPKTNEFRWHPPRFYTEPVDGKYTAADGQIESLEPCACGCGELTVTFYKN